MSLRSGPDVRSREPRERGVYLPSADNKTAIVYTSTPSIARKWTEGPRLFKRHACAPRGVLHDASGSSGRS